jgi:hypothetical protein
VRIRHDFITNLADNGIIPDSYKLINFGLQLPVVSLFGKNYFGSVIRILPVKKVGLRIRIRNTVIMGVCLGVSTISGGMESLRPADFQPVSLPPLFATLPKK